MIAKEAAEANAAAEAALKTEMEERERERQQKEEEEDFKAQKQWEAARTDEIRQHVQSQIRQYCQEQAVSIQQEIPLTALPCDRGLDWVRPRVARLYSSPQTYSDRECDGVFGP
jgi:hypothetical protein